jgi:hypothetical protein
MGSLSNRVLLVNDLFGAVARCCGLARAHSQREPAENPLIWHVSGCRRFGRCDLSGFDFAAQPSLDPKQVREFAGARWEAKCRKFLSIR